MVAEPPEAGGATRTLTGRASRKRIADVRELEAWDHAQALAKVVLDDPKNALAKTVLDAGPFAMRRAAELAEAILVEASEFHPGENVEGHP